MFNVSIAYITYPCIKTLTTTGEEGFSMPPSIIHLPSPNSPAVSAVKQRIDELEEEFMTVVDNLFELLTQMAKKAPDFIDKMRSFLLTLQVKLGMKKQNTPFFTEHRDEIKSCTTVAEFQAIICNYCNFLNFALFESLMKRFGGKELKLAFKLYLDHLHDFRTNTKIGEYIVALTFSGVTDSLPAGFDKISMKMHDSWDQCTLQDLEDFRLSWCTNALVHPHAVSLMHGKAGCFVLVWGVASFALSSLLWALDEAEMAECNIKAINYDTDTPEIEVVEKMEHLSLAASSSDPHDTAELKPLAGESCGYCIQ